MALTDKLKAIADAIRGKTGGTESLTLDQMVTEIAGIEAGGGGGFPLEWEITEYVHSEDWLNNTIGLGSTFASTYCNADDTTDRSLYICYITNNTAPNKAATYMTFQRYGADTTKYICVDTRGGWNDVGEGGSGRAWFISAGANITVIKIATWGVEL